MDPGSPYGVWSEYTSGGPSHASSGFSGTAAADDRLHASQFRSFMMSQSPAASGENFTAQMRDRQARGKDPYTSGNGTDDSDMSDHDLRFGSGGRVQKEDFAETERRRTAISYLDNPEMLMIWAQSTGDSIAGARHHWMKILCGYDNDQSESRNKHHHHSFQYQQGYHQRDYRQQAPRYQPNQKRRAGGSSAHQYYDEDL